MASDAGAGGACRIAIVGAGAISHAVLPLLRDLPIGQLALIDGDRVERKNLERQPLFTSSDTDRPKVIALAERARHMLPGCKMIPHDVFLDDRNARELLRDLDIVVDAVDDLHAKALIDRVCGELPVPLVSGAVHGMQGQVMVFHAPGMNNALGRAQLFPGVVGAGQDGCDMRNVPLALLEDLGRRMAQRIGDVLVQRPVVNGRIELLDRPDRPWMMIEPVA